MIMSIADVVDKCRFLTNCAVPDTELLEDYQLRFDNNGLSYPINKIIVDKREKEILLMYTSENESESKNEPSYYCNDGLSPITAFNKGLISKEEYMGFLKGNIIKYTVRCDKKGNGSRDMDKCIDYCMFLKRLLEDLE